MGTGGMSADTIEARPLSPKPSQNFFLHPWASSHQSSSQLIGGSAGTFRKFKGPFSATWEISPVYWSLSCSLFSFLPPYPQLILYPPPVPCTSPFSTLPLPFLYPTPLSLLSPEGGRRSICRAASTHSAGKPYVHFPAHPSTGTPPLPRQGSSFTPICHSSPGVSGSLLPRLCEPHTLCPFLSRHEWALKIMGQLASWALFALAVSTVVPPLFILPPDWAEWDK